MDDGGKPSKSLEEKVFYNRRVVIPIILLSIEMGTLTSIITPLMFQIESFEKAITEPE